MEYSILHITVSIFHPIRFDKETADRLILWLVATSGMDRGQRCKTWAKPKHAVMVF